MWRKFESNVGKARAKLDNSSSFRNAVVKFASVAVFVDQSDTTNDLFLFSNHLKYVHIVAVDTNICTSNTIS